MAANTTILFNDTSLDFTKDVVSDFVSERFPMFVRMEGENLIAFVEEYYKFLETQMVMITISESAATANISIGDIVCTMTSILSFQDDPNGPVVYSGDGTTNCPVLELEDNINIFGRILSISTLDDTVDSAYTVPRIRLILEHLSGAIENFIPSIYGVLFSPTLLQKVTNERGLPVIYSVEAILPPLNAFNRLHLYNDIDFSFDDELFSGSNYYSLMHNEIMHDIPKKIISPAEEVTKAIIGRNIKDYYKAKGTDDSIKFIFKILFGEEPEIYTPSDNIFSLNNGVWATTSTIIVEKDSNSYVLQTQNLLIYTNDNVQAVVEDIKVIDNTHVQLELSYVNGPFEMGNHVSGALSTGESFSCVITSALTQVESYVANTGLLNGGVQAKLPEGITSWNHNLALQYINQDTIDHIQDSYYYQLFSYVIRTSLSEKLFPEIEKTIKKFAHPAGLKMFIEKK